jgi:hypothetical protein
MGMASIFVLVDMRFLSDKLRIPRTFRPVQWYNCIVPNSAVTYLYIAEQNQNFVKYSLQFFFWSSFISRSKFLIEKLCNQFSRPVLLGTRYQPIFQKEHRADKKNTSTIICALKSNMQFYPFIYDERTRAPKWTPANLEHKKRVFWPSDPHTKWDMVENKDKTWCTRLKYDPSF